MGTPLIPPSKTYCQAMNENNHGMTPLAPLIAELAATVVRIIGIPLNLVLL
jgi:hypothetical protein